MYARSRVSAYKIKKILLCFSHDLTALETAKTMRLNRNTINRYYKFFRQRLANYCESEKYTFEEIKVYENDFEKKLDETKIPRFIKNKMLSVCICARSDRVYTNINNDFKETSNLKCIKIVNSDEQEKNYINENFWVYCKIRLSKFYGIRPKDYYLHIRECEFRYNKRNEDLYKIMIDVIKEF